MKGYRRKVRKTIETTTMPTRPSFSLQQTWFHLTNFEFCADFMVTFWPCKRKNGYELQMLNTTSVPSILWNQVLLSWYQRCELLIRVNVSARWWTMCLAPCTWPCAFVYHSVPIQTLKLIIKKNERCAVKPAAFDFSKERNKEQPLHLQTLWKALSSVA